MIQINQKEDCCGCQACAQICPRHCITMLKDSEGFLYPQTEETNCVQCGFCEKVCPLLHSAPPSPGVPKSYAAYNLDEEVRLHSSSGGIFTLLAENVLAQDGAVYGSAMSGCYVKHIRVTNRELLSLLRGSKYVQSDTGDCYTLAKQDLKAGKNVLFTGTPCQIEGLKAFLGQDYKNLICVDLICHGVPSPMVWQKYVSYREKAAASTMDSMAFRQKTNGWKAYEILFRFANGTVHAHNHSKDTFMQLFLHDLCLRPSCYTCHFKKLHRVSDLTLGDFWGIGEVCPEMDDDKGTSLVIAHSERGLALLNMLSSQIRCQAVPLDAALAGNPAMCKPAVKPEMREQFMAQIQTEDFPQLSPKYLREPITVKIILKRILRKLRVLDLVKYLKKARV